MNAESWHKTHAVGIFPIDAAITRWVAVMLLEQHDARRPKRRYMQLEGQQSLTDTAATRLPAVQR